MTIVTVLPDGKVVARGSSTVTVPLGGGDQPVTITFSELKNVEQVLQYNFHTNPIVDPGTPVNEKIEKNVVGVTLAGVAAGTTLTVEALVVGY